jgi:hypothetical protein
MVYSLLSVGAGLAPSFHQTLFSKGQCGEDRRILKFIMATAKLIPSSENRNISAKNLGKRCDAEKLSGPKYSLDGPVYVCLGE